MPFAPLDLNQKIRDILAHVAPLPVEAENPHTHYQRSRADLWNLFLYVKQNFARLPLQPAAVRRYLRRLLSLILASLVETLERFFKEVAAVCVDFLARFVLDDRFNAFKVQGSGLAAHFGTATLGRALCESATWLDCDDINDRFRRLLANPFESGTFLLFRKQPAADRERYETLGIVWQLRHTLSHNVGVLTQSDAIKFRLMIKAPVPVQQVLAPTRDDARHLKRFLDDTAEQANRRIGERLAELLTTIHAGDPGLLVPQNLADQISQTFGFSLAVAGAAGVPPF